jgi:hypothetical protein
VDAAAGNFLIAPNARLLIWTLIAGLGLLAGGATLAKGRAGWFVVGLLTGGIAWFFTAFLPAAPGSLWARLRGSGEPSGTR